MVAVIMMMRMMVVIMVMVIVVVAGSTGTPNNRQIGDNTEGNQRYGF